MVWSDPLGVKREVCWTVDQGGLLPDGWHAACWPFIAAKAKFILYGAYPNEVLWRVNLTYAIGLIGLIWALVPRFPYRNYLVVASIFFVFCFGMSRYSIYMERKLNRGRSH